MSPSAAPARPGPLRRSRDWLERRPLVMLLVPTVLALGAVALLADLAGAERLDRALRHLHPEWLLLCLGGELLAYAGYVLAVRDTARVDNGPNLTFGHTLQAVVAGFGVFAATRTSGGFAVDYWVLRSAGEERDGAVARVLALGALEYAVLAPAALCSAIALLVSGEDVSLTLTLPWLLVIPGAVVAIWVSSPKRAPRYAKAPRDSGRIRHGFAHGVAGLSILRSMFVAPPREHGLGLLGTALYWAGDIACLWGALQVFGNPRLSVPALILGYATGYVLTRRSLPAGGAGVVEIALTFALHWMGFPFVRALLGVVVYRIFNLWLPILPALATLPAVKELRGELEEAEEAR
ncbi:MAG TPA: lysylphosphatidylglycerol synthase transmembrane domain-containing protein [Gaiellaceae bacterium]|nr:lysylphosphatidylglycerol synthase transmembrane domain-containing protein [Gaiellaceae bacterium]